MTLVALAARLRQECGVSGTAPTTVVGVTGESLRLVNWVITADEDIQRKWNEWRFMRQPWTVQTVAGTPAYSATNCGIANFRDWVKESFKIYLTTSGVAGEMALSYMDYQSWYEIYNTHLQPQSFPMDFTVLNNLSFSLGPQPNAVYTVSGEYQRSVATMALDGDMPIYPSEYHLLAVYKAMMSYGRYSGAPEVRQDGLNLYRELMAEMERTQLPEMLMGSPWV